MQKVGLPARAHILGAGITANGNVQVALDTVDFDPGGDAYGVSTYYFFGGTIALPPGIGSSNGYGVPEDGYYLVQGSVAATSAAAAQQVRAEIAVNSTITSMGSSAWSTAAGQVLRGSVNDIVEATKDSVIMLYVGANAVLNLVSTAVSTYMSVIQVG